MLIRPLLTGLLLVAFVDGSANAQPRPMAATEAKPLASCGEFAPSSRQVRGRAVGVEECRITSEAVVFNVDGHRFRRVEMRISGTEDGWFYGCHSFDDPAGWGWHVVDANMAGAQCNEAKDVNLDLGAGSHTIKFRNREGANFLGDVASLARVLITNDPGYTPGAMD